MYIGFATDHGGYVLKEPILKALRDSGHDVRDFGAYSLNPEDDNMNLLCLGGRVVGFALAWEIIKTYLATKSVRAKRFERRLAKVAAIECKEPIK